MSPDPFITIWEFTVPAEHAAAFVAAYGPAGTWAQLFRKSAGYRGTDLFRDRANPERYVTVDFWTSPQAWEAFKAEFGEEYAALDRACERLTSAERALGSFGLGDIGGPNG